MPFGAVAYLAGFGFRSLRRGGNTFAHVLQSRAADSSFNNPSSISLKTEVRF